MNVLRPGEVLTREKMLLAIEHEEWTWLGRAIGETPEGSVLLPYEQPAVRHDARVARRRGTGSVFEREDGKSVSPVSGLVGRSGDDL